MRGVELMQLCFVTMPDPALGIDHQAFKVALCGMLERLLHSQKARVALVKLYYEVFRRGGREFDLALLRSITQTLSKSLKTIGPKESLRLLGEHFKEDYLESEERVSIFN